MGVRKELRVGGKKQARLLNCRNGVPTEIGVSPMAGNFRGIKRLLEEDSP
jgi:hypothetical protein